MYEVGRNGNSVGEGRRLGEIRIFVPYISRKSFRCVIDDGIDVQATDTWKERGQEKSSRRFFPEYMVFNQKCTRSKSHGSCGHERKCPGARTKIIQGAVFLESSRIAATHQWDTAISVACKVSYQIPGRGRWWGCCKQVQVWWFRKRSYRTQGGILGKRPCSHAKPKAWYV